MIGHRAIAVLLVAALSFGELPANAQRASTDEPPTSDKVDRTALPEVKVIAAIIAASVTAYLAIGRPCACPYNTDKRGSSCGKRSAHSREGGFSPLCFPTDVTPAMFSAFRRGTTITDKAMAANLK